MPVTQEQLKAVLKARFGGVLKKGKHIQNGEACALELLSVVRGMLWTDEPAVVRCWDLRILNDIDLPNEVRTAHLLPVLAAYADSMEWPQEQQQAVATALVLETVRVLVAELPGLPATVVAQCKAVQTVEDARAAALAAHSSHAVSAVWSLEDACAACAACAAQDTAQVASAAARIASLHISGDPVASDAARTRVFIQACQVWLTAARQGTAPPGESQGNL